MATHPARRGWSYAEFARLPDDGNRYEVIDGELFVTPAPQPLHTLVGFKLATVLDAFVVRHDLGWVMPAPVDVLFGDGDYVQPDIVFVRREHGDAITERGIEVPPELVVEVLSPSTALRDRGLKRERYAHFGVPQYWIVDPVRRQVEIYRLNEDPDRAAVLARESFEWQPVPGSPTLLINLSDFMRGFA